LIPPPHLYCPVSPKQLILDYMAATQNGQPIDLSPFLTSNCDWYGEGLKTVQECEASTEEYYRAWPQQSTSYNPDEVTVTRLRVDREAYQVTLPFHYVARNGGKVRSGLSHVSATIVLTTSGVYRISSIRNFH
jgi:hypothetical protein